VSFDPNHRVYHNRSSDYYVHAHFFYDEELQAKRSIEFAEVANEAPVLFDILELFGEKVGYAINIREKTCKKFDIDYPFVPNTPPKFANFSGYATIGSSGIDGVDLAQYEARDEERGVALYQTYTARDCIPVRNDFISDDTGFHYEQHSDVTLGVDVNVFEPPADCK
jgi:hypothetical protein